MSRTASACWATASIARTLRNELPTIRTVPRAFQSKPAPSRCLHSATRQQLSSPLRATASQPQHPHFRARHFSTSRSQKYKTVQQAESRHRSGPFSWAAGALFLLSGAGLILYFRYEKARMERKRIAEATKGIGKPKVYFGFTHCPDICPEELDKMAIMIDKVKETSGNVMRPIFITCDPARDTPVVMKRYLREFHPDIIGLTGTWEDIKSVCKAYRVYFSTPADVKPGQDYLVDHSIYFYLMDPEGDFVEAIGRNFSPDQAARVINNHIKDWRDPLDKS
ncbi:Cu-binding protein [Coniosporium tulheliwenetii]|uniref:Cu-binding protein n=1 Tax=Coniosporium tulheliwenetii TaxID=3383036 RepID=A0ACC2Z0X4_9PEZI|nr:Cu-binding protein [Cladosporium sp. JES 115]